MQISESPRSHGSMGLFPCWRSRCNAMQCIYIAEAHRLHGFLAAATTEQTLNEIDDKVLRSDAVKSSCWPRASAQLLCLQRIRQQSNQAQAGTPSIRHRQLELLSGRDGPVAQAELRCQMWKAIGVTPIRGVYHEHSNIAGTQGIAPVAFCPGRADELPHDTVHQFWNK